MLVSGRRSNACNATRQAKLAPVQVDEMPTSGTRRPNLPKSRTRDTPWIRRSDNGSHIATIRDYSHVLHVSTLTYTSRKHHHGPTCVHTSGHCLAHLGITRASRAYLEVIASANRRGMLPIIIQSRPSGPSLNRTLSTLGCACLVPAQQPERTSGHSTRPACLRRVQVRTAVHT